MNSLLPHHRHRGFTLIELVLYISIMSILLLGLAVLMSTILETRERHQVIAEVEQQGIQIMQKLTQSLKDADSVELPVLGSSGSTLSLTPHENAANTTVFTIQDGILTSTVSILPSISLHNDAIFLTDLVFLNVGLPGTPGSVRISFTVVGETYAGDRLILRYSQIFQSTATLHNP